MENHLTNLSVRVYGLLIKEGKLMFLREKYGDRELIKFPGGGLELGEGARQTLERELKEELNLDIKVGEHIYTQDFFLKSSLTPATQLLTIYYFIDCEDISTLKIIEAEIKEILWIPLQDLNVEEILLPTDKIVVDKILKDIFL